ncbi:IS1 family transposase [Budviciaceae bacterium BWR-B9]|uniref:IS1 family transposase n=1 Tax=Limnobaculum allomyrinae TaxID=2791986 RepID=A0ABS1IQ81_9GAMM|nr:MULTISPECIES: hypothetical protein [Limnobaculum]MBK5143701.1 IS1 family transposase [Limnobaculum allomyrinae]MBV7692717.1 hypothetical protein [Limnobaculum sp. M2-1]
MKKDTPICHYCGRADRIKRHGIGRTGRQRYYCAECKKTFQTYYIYKGKEQNIALQIERLLAENYTPERISNEMQVRLATIEAHIRQLQASNL